MAQGVPEWHKDLPLIRHGYAVPPSPNRFARGKARVSLSLGFSLGVDGYIHCFLASPSGEAGATLVATDEGLSTFPSGES